MGKKKDDEKQKAYDLFCNTQLTQKEIASVVHVTPQQLGKWVKDGNWDMYRTAQQTSTEGIIHGYFLQLAEINKDVKENHKGIPSTSHSDTISKITDAIQKLRKKYNLSAYHSVLREYLEWVMKVDSEAAKLFGPSMLEFLKEKAKSINNDQSIG